VGATDDYSYADGAMSGMTVLVDMDGVLCDFVTSFLAAYHRAGGIGAPSQPIRWGFVDELPDKVAVADAWRDRHLWLDEHPYTGALSGLMTLHHSCAVYVVTDAGPHPEIAIPAKLEWLAVHAPWFPAARRFISIPQRDLLRADVLVDDYATNAHSWLAANGNGARAFVPRRSWNEREWPHPCGELNEIAAEILKGG